jgi:hypothetical protein
VEFNKKSLGIAVGLRAAGGIIFGPQIRAMAVAAAAANAAKAAASADAGLFRGFRPDADGGVADAGVPPRTRGEPNPNGFGANRPGELPDGAAPPLRNGSDGLRIPEESGNVAGAKNLFRFEHRSSLVGDAANAFDTPSGPPVATGPDAVAGPDSGLSAPRRLGDGRRRACLRRPPRHCSAAPN